MERLFAIFKLIISALFNVSYCERCGGVIWNKNITRCPHCDFKVRGADEKSWGLFALGMIPGVGLIAGLIAGIVCAAKGKKRKAKSAFSGMAVGILLVAAAVVLALLAFDVI